MAKYNVGDVVRVTHKSDRWNHHFNENVPVTIIEVYSEDVYEAVDVWNIKQTLHDSHIVGLWERDTEAVHAEPKEETQQEDEPMYKVGDKVRVTHRYDDSCTNFVCHWLEEEKPATITNICQNSDGRFRYDAVQDNLKQILGTDNIVGLWEDELDEEPEEDAVDLTNKEPEVGDYITLKPQEECIVRVGLDRSRPIKINDITKNYLFNYDIYWVTGYDIYGKPLQQAVIRNCIESVALPPEEEVPESENGILVKELIKFMYDL